MLQKRSDRLTNRSTTSRLSVSPSAVSCRPQTGASTSSGVPSTPTSPLAIVPNQPPYGQPPQTPLPPLGQKQPPCINNSSNNNNGDSDTSCQPMTIDFEYRAVIVGTAHVVMDIRGFRSMFNGKLTPAQIDVKALPAAVDAIIAEVRIDRIAAQHRRDLLKILTNKRNEHAVRKHRIEANIIVTAGRQARHFETLTRSLVPRMRHYFDEHVRRYFLSYLNQRNANDIPAVQDYEDYIKKNTDFVAASLNDIEADLGEYTSLQETFLSNYLENLPKALSIIDRVCVNSLKVCGTLKQWVYQDKDYTKKLWDYIISTNMRRGKLLEEIRRCHRKKSELSFQIVRKEESHNQASKRLEERRQQGQKVASTRETLTNDLQETKCKVETKAKELEDMREAFLNRTSNSAAYVQAITLKMEKLKEDVEALETQQVALQRQIGKLDASGQNLGVHSEKISIEREANVTSLVTLKEHMEEVRKSLERLEEQSRHQEEMVALARHIRGLKVSSAQLKKLYIQHQDGQYV